MTKTNANFSTFVNTNPIGALAASLAFGSSAVLFVVWCYWMFGGVDVLALFLKGFLYFVILPSVFLVLTGGCLFFGFASVRNSYRALSAWYYSNSEI